MLSNFIVYLKVAKIPLHSNYITNYIILMENDHTIIQVLGYRVVTTWAQVQSRDRLKGFVLAKLAEQYVFIQVLWFSHQCSHLSTINATVYDTDSIAK